MAARPPLSSRRGWVPNMGGILRDDRAPHQRGRTGAIRPRGRAVEGPGATCGSPPSRRRARFQLPRRLAAIPAGDVAAVGGAPLPARRASSSPLCPARLDNGEFA